MGTATPKEFFEALWSGVGAGFIELRPLVKGGQPSGDRAWFAWPGEIDAFLAKALPTKANVYFGVGLRKEHGKGKAEDVGSLTAVWADIDYKQTPKEKVFETLKGFPLRPSMAGIGDCPGRACRERRPRTRTRLESVRQRHPGGVVVP